MAWLLKAEPDSRIVKGKDVKFSVDDFESVKTSPWEGVRNYEARNLMKAMKVGEKALFYHSNCKNPGIAAFAEVSKEAYPDYTAWDSSHPYHDPKSDPNSPKWFMVDLTFTSRTNHFVPLALLKHIASTYTTPPTTKSDSNSNSDSQEGELPKSIAYIGLAGAKAIKEMDLLNRGRLSIQRVQQQAWDTIALLAERGGWENDEQLLVGKAKSKAKAGKVTKSKAKKGDDGSKGSKTSKGKGRSTRKKAEEEEEEEDADDVADTDSDGDDKDDEYQPKRRGGGGVKRKRKPAAGSDSDMEFAPARAGIKTRTKTKKTRRS